MLPLGFLHRRAGVSVLYAPIAAITKAEQGSWQRSSRRTWTSGQSSTWPTTTTPRSSLTSSAWRSCRPTAPQNIAAITKRLAITGRASKNVALKKGKADALKSKLFARLGIKILMAARSKGTDPSKNLDLARALREAASHKLPKENIERAIKKASDKATGDYTRGVYEIRVAGAGILVTTLTDSPNRAVKAIKERAGKAEGGAKFLADGSVAFSFENKGVLRLSEGEGGEDLDQDRVIEAAFAADIDDVDFAPDDDGHGTLVLTSPEDLFKLQEALSRVGLLLTGELEMVAAEKVELGEAEREQVLGLIESLEDLDDVDKVFTNLALSPSGT